MIPEFDDNGNLPPGVHPATLAEIATRFGTGSEVRQAQLDSLRWLVPCVIRAGGRRLIINGSFVTDVVEPNDVDCVVLVGDDYPNDQTAAQELQDGLPFLDIQIVSQEGFEELVQEFFSTDRFHRSKGMIEVLLWE